MPFDLAESFILAAERELGAVLPSSYRQAMLRANGGELEADGEEWEQHPIADNSDRRRLSRTVNHIIMETQTCRGWSNFPEAALAIAINATGDRLVFLKKGAAFEPAVLVWSHETGALRRVANDFAELQAP